MFVHKYCQECKQETSFFIIDTSIIKKNITAVLLECRKCKKRIIAITKNGELPQTIE